MALSFVASATSSQSTTLTAMASINAGDLLVFIDAAFNDTTSDIPSGFTLVYDTDVGFTNSGRYQVSYKLADGTEDSAVLTGMAAGSNTVCKVLLQFRESGFTPSGAEVFSVNYTMTDGDPDDQITTASGGIPPLVAFGVFGSQAAISGETFTASDGSVALGSAFTVARQKTYYKLYDASPADETAAMGDLGAANTIGVFYIKLSAGTPTTDLMPLGSYTETGFVFTEHYGTGDAMPLGSYAETGQTVNQQYVQTMGTVGSYTVTGVAFANAWRDHFPAAPNSIWREPITNILSPDFDETFLLTPQSPKDLPTYRTKGSNLQMRDTRTNRRVNNKWWARLLNGRN